MSTAVPPPLPSAREDTDRHGGAATRKTKTRPPLSVRKKLTFLLVMLSFTWLCAEGLIYIRLRDDDFYWASEKTTRLVDEMPNNLVSNSRYIWEYEPGSQYTYTDPRDDVSYSVRVNSEGFRDEEPAARAGARFQFVALGDSFTFGWLVEQPQRWDEVLAKSIHKKHGIPAASVNLGMWMTTFDQHALILEDNLPKKCSAVIHFVYPSHLQTINRHVVRSKKGKIVSIYDPMLHLKDHALFYGAVDTALVHKKLSFPFSLCLWNFSRNVRRLRETIDHTHTIPDMTDEQVYQQESQAIFARGYGLMERSIAQTAAFLKERNIPYIVAIVPRDRQLHELEWNFDPPNPEILNSTIPQDRIRRACDATGHAICLDLLPTMKREYHNKLYYRHDAHWRPQGHQLAAEDVLDLLEQRGLLSPYRAVKRTAAKP